MIVAWTLDPAIWAKQIDVQFNKSAKSRSRKCPPKVAVKLVFWLLLLLAELLLSDRLNPRPKPAVHVSLAGCLA